MNPFHGMLVKLFEVGILYPMHRITHHQHVHNKKLQPTIKAITKKGYSQLYKGIQFQIVHSCINRFADIQIYNTYGHTSKSASLSYLMKSLSFPLQTMEIYYQFNNKPLNNIEFLYKGFVMYNISNLLGYTIWHNSMNLYSDCFADLAKHSDKIHTVCTGFACGVTTDAVLNPIKVIKTNVQSQKLKLKDITKVKKFIHRGLGLRLLISGFQNVIFCICIKH